MLKICGSAICKPLAITFKQYVDTGIFPTEWKKGNIVPIYKRRQTNIEKLSPSIVTPNLWKNS